MDRLLRSFQFARGNESPVTDGNRRNDGGGDRLGDLGTSGSGRSDTAGRAPIRESLYLALLAFVAAVAKQSHNQHRKEDDDASGASADSRRLRRAGIDIEAARRPFEVNRFVKIKLFVHDE